jgi:uncharacterized membrane protein YciS (DUF1049 family)
MLDVDVIPNGNTRVPVQVLKATDFLALTLNAIFVSLVALMALVVLALSMGLPDYNLTATPKTFGIVSSIGLGSLFIVNLLIPYVVSLNVVSFTLKMINDTSQSWRFLLSKKERHVSFIVSILAVLTAIVIITNIGLHNN